ncbi:XkdQ/YqbQ family protein [Cohnella caldifontis]|uniref:XkdQ/YqbQ family protein n=1 Tax=Cohnella caldifontis TaxID=3027471 RepID=UPI0023EBDCCF|nr:phage portal protein [Cohnella sp. YIM B05605]
MSWEIVLAGKHDISDFVEEITLEESLDEIACRANIRLLAANGLPSIAPGQEIRLSDLQGSKRDHLLHPGVVWECRSDNGGTKHLEVTAYDRSIYLAKSEDEKLMPAGQTASQRLRAYAKEWNIPVGSVADTEIKLSRNIKRAQSIMSMILEDLRETADKGGGLFRVRMTPEGVGLVKLGSNAETWELATPEQVSQTRTLEGAVTQVKVLGASPGENKLSPVLAIVRKDTDKYGTLQKVVDDCKIETPGQAKAAANKLLLGLQESFAVTAPDIRTIRAGDLVRLNGIALLVTRVTHRLGEPGHMDLELAAAEKVRRDYFA